MKRVYCKNHTPCHPEPFDFAQDKLREGSQAGRILRFAQNDNADSCIPQDTPPYLLLTADR